MNDKSSPSRDFNGYADQSPSVVWPDEARVAINFCITRRRRRTVHFINPATTAPKCAHPTWKSIHALVTATSTSNRVTSTVHAMIDSGFDLQPHGWRWIDFDSVDENTEREFIRRSIEQVRELTGAPPLGYYAGMPSLNTRRLVVEAGSFVYDSDVYNGDLPYWSTDYPGLLLVPYSLDTNDSKFGRGEHDYQLGDEFFTYLKDRFDTLYAEGETHPKMMTVGLHARLLGRPGRIGSLHKFLDYLLKHQKVWICRRDDLAQHWAEH